MTWAMALSAEEEERLRPLYSRVLRLRHVDPGGVLCFLYFEGMVSLGLLLALAELVSWWAVFLLPVSVAAMVKANDLVAAAVARTAARVPAEERQRFRRELQPAVGRARVPGVLLTAPGSEPPTDALTGVAAPGAVTAPGMGTVSGGALSAGAFSAGRRGPGAVTVSGGERVPGAVTVPGGALPRTGRGPGVGVVGTDPVDGSRIPGPARVGGFAPGIRDVGGRLIARLVPAGRPLSMTSMVRARLASGARPRPESDWEPRPDLDPMERLRAGVPGLSPLTVTASSVAVPPASRVAPDHTGGEAWSDRDAGAPWSAPAEQSNGQQTGVSGSSAAGHRRNDRVVDRPTRRWLVRLDPMDSGRQRARQSARRRYE